jgi:hypothetical protein
MAHAEDVKLDILVTCDRKQFVQILSSFSIFRFSTVEQALQVNISLRKMYSIYL